MEDLARYEIHANKLLLISNSCMSKVDSHDLVILSMGNSFFKVTKNKLGLYTYVIMNSDGFTQTVTIDNKTFISLMVRAFVVMGFREIDNYPVDK